MGTPLQVLLVEDSEDDALLTLNQLRGNGFDPIWERVETAGAMRATLERNSWDIIISDMQMPQFDGLKALTIRNEDWPGVPFILVSGTIGEDVAVSTMKRGANDYLLKGHLKRLATAVERELRDAVERRERKRAEDTLRQFQKLDAIGRLAGGMAHDFNNHLGIIIGYSERLLERLGSNDPLRKNAGMIKEAALRAASLTRQLLAFSRRQVFESRVLDLNAVVSELGNMLRPLIGEDIELVTSLNPALGKVRADPAQIDQIIMNLAVNARDAMPQGGRLTIETTNVELDESYTSKHVTVQPGPYVMLAVSDTGIGMDKETQARIFEPFFTTKEKGKGTGLGLAMVYGIVKQSGGYIWAYSEPGQGTTFKIYLPRVEAGIREAEAERASPSASKGEETVLVVEDEGMLRELSCEFLQSGGYTVLEAGNGAEAIEISKRHQGPIHLLMTDVVMPGMSGRELAQRLPDHRPGMKVLYVSGYTDDTVLRNGLLEPGTAFLQKPFTRDSLVHKVRDVLDRKNET